MEYSVKLQNYINDTNQRKPRYRADFIGMYEYDNGTKSVLLPAGGVILKGQDFRDTRGKLNVVTEIIEHRPHKGVFDDENKRNTIAIVRSEIIPDL